MKNRASLYVIPVNTGLFQLIKTAKNTLLKKTVVFVLVSLLFVTAQASDSLTVNTLSYVYFTAGIRDTTVDDARKLDAIANYKGATLYYTPTKYKLYYSNSYYDLGDLEADHTYSIYDNIANEGLSPMQTIPEVAVVNQQSRLLWADDYHTEATSNKPVIAGVLCTEWLVQPKDKNIDISYLVCTTADYPAQPWSTYTFLGLLPGCLMSFTKITNQGESTEGFSVSQYGSQVVNTDFFDLPQDLPINPMLMPPVVPRK